MRLSVGFVCGAVIALALAAALAAAPAAAFASETHAMVNDVAFPLIAQEDGEGEGPSDSGEPADSSAGSADSPGSADPADPTDPADPEPPDLAAPAPIDIADATVTLAKSSYACTGKAIEPKPKVALGGTALKAGRDFTVSYKKNRAVGTATVTVKGTGAYAGTACATFAIVPGKAGIVSAKSAKPGQIAVKARKAVGAKRLQYQVSATRSFAKAVRKKTTTKTAFTFANLKKGRTYYVRVRARADVGGRIVYGPWSKARAVKTLRDGTWKTEGGYVHFIKYNGKPAKGLTVIGGKTYLFDGAGRQKTGWQRYQGVCRFFTVANGAKGCMRAGCVVNGIKLRRDGTAVEEGTAAAELSIMLKAQALLEALTVPTQSQTEKLRAGFVWIRDACGERGPSQLYVYDGWHRDLALHIFDGRSGSCFACGAAFAYYANAVGCKTCRAVGCEGHGWAEVDGLVYDIEWERWTDFELFAHPYDAPYVEGVPQYARARSYVVQIAPNASRW